MSKGGVFMTKSDQVNLGIIEDFRMGKISRKEAALKLGVTERSITRRAKKVREKGAAGIKHGNYGRIPKNKTGDNLRQRMLHLAQNIYPDFNMAHCLEMLATNHELNVGYTTFRTWCRQSNIGKRKKRRPSKARAYRERMANEGFLLQMDGSHHEWNGQDKWCLIAMIDDATSKVPAARFFDSETTIACMKVLRECIEKKGIPEIIYTDGAGWAGGSEKRRHFSQFVRACEELGIKVIPASSAEAKGRIERLWRTLQDRLVPELRLYDIKSMIDANRYLDQCFLPNYWDTRNIVAPISSACRYRQLSKEIDLNEIFCMKYSRVVRNDQTVLFEGHLYKILGPSLGSLRGKEITIHAYENGSLGLFYGHIRLEFSRVIRPIRMWTKKSA